MGSENSTVYTPTPVGRPRSAPTCSGESRIPGFTSASFPDPLSALVPLDYLMYDFPLVDTMPLPSRPLTDTIVFKSCRACSGRFEYELESGKTVIIVVGIPHGEYKAISHVWNRPARIKMRCSRCSATMRVRMQSANKFHNLMVLAGANTTIWLDVLSIDQTDHSDVLSQLSVMGDIYGNAEDVAVLLPSSDEEAYIRLKSLVVTAKTILRCHTYFEMNHPGDEGDERLSKLCQKFYTDIELFENNIQKWVYWRRAWTFQEWTRARDISISWDSLSQVDTIKEVKSSIVLASILMSEYKLQVGQYVEISLGFSRGEVPQRFERIKRLFPYEDFFLCPEEVDEEKLLFHTACPNFGTSMILGIRSQLLTSDFARFRARLSTMLNALGLNKRESEYEADLVGCWAAMCNIKYDYDEEDTIAIALQKVLRELRLRGITIYNFLANTDGACGEVDLRFFEYATAHRQCNATNEAFFLGTPIFTGRADTVVHLLNAITLPEESPSLKGSGVSLRKVEKADIDSVTRLSETTELIRNFSKVTSGIPGMNTNFMFTDVIQHVASALVTIPREQLDRRVLVIASIPITNPQDKKLCAWAVCPAHLSAKDLFVAREGLNGTLVLATKRNEFTHIVAYLSLTDNECGTLLIKVDEQGKIEMSFNTPRRSDMGFSFRGGYMGDRELRTTIELKRNSLIAFGK